MFILISVLPVLLFLWLFYIVKLSFVFALAIALVSVQVAWLLWAFAVGMRETARGRLTFSLCYFSVALFVSAFLLFLVQPMIGKMILPGLGGTPQVWNTCVMFFQTVLLAGYAYTHNLTSKVPVKTQLFIHCIALALPLPVLLAFGRPFPVAGFGAEGGGNPIVSTLVLLSLVVGIPFLIVSTTSPLLQRWFNHTGDPAAKDPYFLSAASNAGSLLGLVFYPTLVERYLGLDEQAWLWLGGYIALAVLVAGCTLIVMRAPPAVLLAGAGGGPEPEVDPHTPIEPPPPDVAITAAPPPPAAAPRINTGIKRGGKQRGRGGKPQQSPVSTGPSIAIRKSSATAVSIPAMTIEDGPDEITPLRRLRWVGLAAVPSSLMLGTTTYISTDISPMPLLWIVPLTLYLLSFINVFLRLPLPWVGLGRNSPGWTPHKAMLVVQLLAVPLMMLTWLTSGYGQPEQAMLICWGAFFVTALVCHGELARDRPPTRYLTEFYLWMSVGGMIGGVFNGLVAPLVPWFGLFEFPLAIVFAGMVRPTFKGPGWIDTVLGADQTPSGKSISLALDLFLPLAILVGAYLLISTSLSSGWDASRVVNPSDYGKPEQIVARNMNNPLFKLAHKTLGLGDWLSFVFTKVMFPLLTYGLMMGCALLAWKRPIRIGLGLGSVLLAGALYERTSDDERTLCRDRSYFGLLRVMEQNEHYTSQGKDRGVLASKQTYLMHGTTHHGLNFHYPIGVYDGSTDSSKLDMRRIATTYYHRFGPVGSVMEKLNWFPGYKKGDGKDGDLRMTYWADARLPASLIGNGAAALGMGFPLPQIVTAWSEPAYATVGLGTGTMASYSRPFQHVVFYEIDEHIRDFSLPPDGSDPYFTYLQGALRRGAKLEVIMGDARLTMKKEQKNEVGYYYVKDFANVKDGNRLQWETGTVPDERINSNKRESYYRALELDAFSSDAIPVHLITKEAIELYMEKLVPEGVLMVHTSNRHVNLVLPVLKICEEAKWRDWTDLDANGKPKEKTGLKWTICKDGGGEGNARSLVTNNPSASGHFGSEYVLVARKQEYLPPYSFIGDMKANLTQVLKQEGLNDEQIAKRIEQRIEEYRASGAYTSTYTYKQDEDFRLLNLKVLPKDEGRLYSSTIDFYIPGSYNDSKVNPTLRNGNKLMDEYGYVLPPNMRIWTDDYSNVLSVFRWKH